MIPCVGEYRYTCDEQGRINIPAKIRELLALEKSPHLVVMKGLDGCIYALPFDAWEEFRALLTNDSLHSEREGRFFRRTLFRGSEVQQPDSQGRIQISKELRAHAKIKKDVVVYGTGYWLEIWNAELFDEYMKVAPKYLGGSLEELASKFLYVGAAPGARRD